jgi:hypothetical protein
MIGDHLRRRAMEHPNIKLEIEMAYDAEFSSYLPLKAGLTDDSPYRGQMSFDECVEAITFLTDFLSSYNLLEPDDHPDDMDKVSQGSEQLLVDALYQVHGRWDGPASGEPSGYNEDEFDDEDEEEEEDEADGGARFN